MSNPAFIPKVIIDNRRALLIPSIVAAVLVFIVMKLADDGMANDKIKFGQVQFQMAFTEARMMEMVMSLTKNQKFWFYVSLLVGKL